MQRSTLSVNGSAIELAGKRALFALLCLIVGALCVSTARADDDDDDRKWRKGRHSWVHEHHGHRRHDHDRDRRSEHRDSRRDDWHRYESRYWAPADYRGRQCRDRRHHRDVHYHVIAQDYYDHYYPRYRYYGPAPRHANASVIITLPLW